MGTIDLFTSIISSFPTAIPSVLLIVILLYWALAIFGLVELNKGHAHFEIGHHGVGHHPIAHIDHHPDLHHGHDSDHHELSGLASLLMVLGLNQIPFSIVLSLLTLFTWVLTYLSHRYLLIALPDFLRWILGAVALVVLATAALPITALCLRPMRRMFVIHNAVNNASFVGQTCRVLTLEVTENFGRAEVSGLGAGYNIRVWAKAPNQLKKGSMALVVGYDSKLQQFEVEEVLEIEAQESAL